MQEHSKGMTCTTTAKLAKKVCMHNSSKRANGIQSAWQEKESKGCQPAGPHQAGSDNQPYTAAEK